MKYLVLPKDRYSCIDYYLENTENPKEEIGIKIEDSAYMRMKQDPYLRLIERTETEEKWLGDEVTLNGIYFPPLQFTIRKVEKGYIVLEIQNGSEVYCYSDSEISIVLQY